MQSHFGGRERTTHRFCNLVDTHVLIVAKDQDFAMPQRTAHQHLLNVFPGFALGVHKFRFILFGSSVLRHPGIVQ